jgi:glycerol uptake facilitator-like aquaporin
LTIAIDILFAGPLTGGAISPARVFGPALAVSFWDNHYVYWIGPMLGGALAGFVYKSFLLPKS